MGLNKMYEKIKGHLIFIIILLMLVYPLIYFQNQTEELEERVEDLELKLSIYWNPINDTGLTLKKINGVEVYSDINNFSRIESLMDDLNFTSKNYPYLQLVYYQNKYTNCSGFYEDEPSWVGLYKCDGNVEIRGIEFTERMILAHELGHYVMDTNELYGEEFADSYSKRLESYIEGHDNEGGENGN